MSTKKRVKRLIVEYFDIEPDLIVRDANLFNDLGMDDSDRLDLVMYLEEEFGTVFPEDSLDDFVMVSDLVAFIKEDSD